MTKKRKYIRRDPLESRRALTAMTAQNNFDGTLTFFDDSTLRTMATDDVASPTESLLRSKLKAKREAERQSRTAA